MTSRDHDLTLVRRIAASPRSVYRCWTEPELVRKWFAPQPVETTRAEIDPRPGGRFNTAVRAPGQPEMFFSGCFLVTEPAERLIWTSSLSEGFRPTATDDSLLGFTFTCELTFAPIDTGCEYRVVLRHASAEEARKHAAMGFEHGWGSATSQLGELAGRLD